MSRIGKKPILIPNGVTVTVAGQHLAAKGPKGELFIDIHPLVKILISDKEIAFTVDNQSEKKQKELWGTSRQLASNIIAGVFEGYTRALEIKGVGYKAEVKGGTLVLSVGYSHPVNFNLPAGVTAEVEKNIITLHAINKQLIGETAAKIRKVRPPEPYKGKGIKFVEETILRKAGKQVKSGGAG